jgi:hypothetical protein
MATRRLETTAGEEALTMRPTFENWKDRVVYLLAEAQLLLVGLSLVAGVLLIWWSPSIPSVPSIVVDAFIVAFLLVVPLGFAGYRIGRKLRYLQMVQVTHLNAVTDSLEWWLVPPEMWRERQTDGKPDTYRMDGKEVAREFDYDDATDDLRVRGVWLEEIQDAKLLTSRRHMKRIYDEIPGLKVTVGVLRDSISQMGAELQTRLINRIETARERGTLLDKSAVTEVFEDYETKADDLGTSDLEAIGPDDVPDWEDLEEEAMPEDVATNGEVAPTTDD